MRNVQRSGIASLRQRRNLATDAHLGSVGRGELHFPGFARMMLITRLLMPNVHNGHTSKRGKTNDELENQIGPRNTHSFGDVGAYVCASKRNCNARRGVGAVSHDGWSVGDLRFALRETEIEHRGGFVTDVVQRASLR
jgi:hypothetical protein